MKLWKIFSHEFTYLVRLTTTWLYAAVLLLFTLVMNGLTTPGDGVFANNTFHITAIVVVGGLIWLVMGAATAGQAAARDVHTRMYALTYTTPVSKLHYLGGRFLATFLVNALLVLFLPLGTLLSFYLPGMNDDALQPFRPWVYGSVYLLIALPNALVATALQFAFAALSRQVMTSYMASLILAIVAQVLAIAAAKLFGNWDLVKLLDPIGISGIVGNELQTWTPTEKNTRLVSLDGLYLGNRVLWLSVAAGAWWFTYRYFHFEHRETKNWRSRFKNRLKQQVESHAETTVIAKAFKMPQVRRSRVFTTRLSQVTCIANRSFKQIARNPAGILPVATMAIASVVFAGRILTHFGIPLLPTTQQVLAYLTAPAGNISTAWGVMPLLILYFAGQLVWSERDAGISDIADTAPVPDWVLFIGKLLGLGCIILVWMTLLMAAGIGMQLSLGYYHLELGLYVQALFELQLADYLLFALLATVVHVVVNQKFVGYLAVFLILLFMAMPATFGVEHPMLVYGKDPGWWYTDMRGFSPTLGPLLLFKIYWMAWAMLLTLAACLLWVRGKQQGWKYRIQLMHRRLKGSTRWVAITGTGLLLASGGIIFYNTNVLNEYKSSSEVNSQKAIYERRFGKYRNTPQPQRTGTKLHVEIYPNQKQVDIRASYTLVNTYAVAIDSIHVASMAGINPDAIVFNRPATAVLLDQEQGHRIYALKQPLLPGDSLQLKFRVRYKQEGFGHTSAQILIVKNGTYFTNYNLLPSIGYLHYREIKDAVLRKKLLLSAKPVVPALDDREARTKPFNPDQSTFEAIIGTAADEVAVAPGVLHKEWTAGGRRYFHYKTAGTIGGEYAILSAKYRVLESRWNNVAIRIYYHPSHARNINRMLRSVKASLAYFTEQFGPYPYTHFTVAERPGAGGGATADASMVNYGEQYALMIPDDGPTGFDLPYYILAHEVAHQWWGLARLNPANVAGAGVLIEGLAVYSGMQVLEKTYGAAHLRQYVAYLHAAYAMPRSLATPSLLEANEDFLYYRKGGLALYALSKYLGKEKVNGALRSLLQKHSAKAIPLPTTLNLFQELKTITPDSLQYLLHDLFKANTYWRLKTKQFAARQIKGGKWEVTLKVQAQKVVVDATGNEKELPMNDLLEIGIYEANKTLDEPLYLRLHRIRSGAQTIKVTVARKPDHGGIDPNYLMIDLRLDDNLTQRTGD